MATVKLDHAYVSVKDMDRAIKFYEDLLDMKVTHREKDTWADFDIGSGVYFGLINSKIMGDKHVVGNNAIPAFWSDDVDATFEKVKKWECEIVDEPTNLDLTEYNYRYNYFQFYDTEGNLVEVAKYDK